MAEDRQDQEALVRLLDMVDGSLLPSVKAGRAALNSSGLAGEQHVRKALHHLTEVESDLACLLASHGVWT